MEVQHEDRGLARAGHELVHHHIHLHLVARRRVQGDTSRLRALREQLEHRHDRAPVGLGPAQEVDGSPCDLSSVVAEHSLEALIDMLHARQAGALHHRRARRRGCLGGP
eukprot:766842-Hanusia_phi.AAC.1